MADEKRDNLRTDARRKQLTAEKVTRGKCSTNYWLFDSGFDTGYDAGHAAATAEGIPQADGWVAIKSIADLPTVNGRYVTQEWSGILRIQDYDSHRRKLWFSSVLAYLPKPIQPYQRQSSEGDSNER